MTKRKKPDHRSLTRTQVAQQQQGGQYLKPGVWIDRDGGLHFSVPEILKHLGLPDTPADREMATHFIGELLRVQCPAATVIEQDDEAPDA
jgi:hypothetical protein